METVYFFSIEPNLSFSLDVEGTRHQFYFHHGILDVHSEEVLEAIEKIASRINIWRLDEKEMEAIRGESLLNKAPAAARGTFHTLKAPLPGVGTHPGEALNIFESMKQEHEI